MLCYTDYKVWVLELKGAVLDRPLIKGAVGLDPPSQLRRSYRADHPNEIKLCTVRGLE